jgi:hypothetical protein
MTSPPWQGVLLRLLLTGYAAIVFQITLASLLITFAPPVPWLAAGFLMGVPLGAWITRPLRGLAFPAIGLMALTGIAPAFVIDVPLWGRVVNLQDAHDVPMDAGISGYQAPGWRIDMERASDERLTVRRGRGYGTRRLAPLVRRDWTPDHPVDVWVSGETRDSGRTLPSHPQFWKEPGGEFIRLVGNDVSMAQLAAGRAAQKFGLQTAPEPLVVTRVASVDRALADQHWALVRAMCFPLALWTLFIAIAAAVLKSRDARPARRN